jgi:hypothetical protein
MTSNLKTLRTLSLANQRKFSSENNMQELYYWNGFNNAIRARIGGESMIDADERRATYQRAVEIGGENVAEESARLRGFEAGMIA